MTAVEVAASEPARFAPHAEWFVCGEHGGFYCVQAWAPAERLLDHVHALAAHLGSAGDARMSATVDGTVDVAVDVSVHHVSSSRRWAGTHAAVSAVRDALTRVRLALAAYGGVELSLATDSEQLVLTPDLRLVVYSTTPRWPYLCEARGLTERLVLPAPDWVAPTRVGESPAALTQALELFAQRLGLLAVHA
jgi:hypothetical protein